MRLNTYTSVYLDCTCLCTCIMNQPYILLSLLCLSKERGVESRPQRDQKPLLREQGGAEGDAGEGQAQGAGDHTLVQPHRRDLPLQVVGQPAEPQAVHGSQQHPSHVTRN